MRLLLVLLASSVLAAPAAAARLRLVPEGDAAGVQAGVMKPFVVDLVAERDSAHREMSAVAYRLAVPEGVVVLGEELLVQSILALGSSREGVNLVFRCTEGPTLRVLRFRFVATKPLADVAIELGPEPRTDFLGVVSCRTEDFDKFACEPFALPLSAR